ncbi:hypothetical protein V8F33_011163 [Rhypophila sp. PSN 637]
MGLLKESSTLLLITAAFFSAATARSCKPCRAKDSLLVLFRSDDFSAEALPFCSSFLDLPASTSDLTVTPTVVSTVTETDHVTELLTSIETSTVTTTVTAVPAPAGKRDSFVRRAVDYPSWLPTKYLPARVSSACHCLGVPLAVTTRTVSDPAVTLTTTAMVTDTTSSTIHSTVIATTTNLVQPLASSIVERRALLQVISKSTNAAVGWIYISNGPAITSDPTRAVPVSFNLTTGATTASTVRLVFEGYNGALSFSAPASVRLENFYGALASYIPTPPGSPPAIVGSTKYASDIFTVDATTGAIGWDWIESDGTHSSPIYLYRVGGRAYPVGNLATFNAAFASVSTSSRYEIYLKAIFI